MMELQEFNKSSLKQLERSDNDIKFWIEFYSYSHRDYKRIEAASGNEPRNKLNKSNGGQI